MSKIRNGAHNTLNGRAGQLTNYPENFDVERDLPVCEEPQVSHEVAMSFRSSWILIRCLNATML
eukprot:2615784-Amphidinium_carterae.1